MVYYLHGDHLGSTSLTTNQSGALVSQARYLPYGEERWTNGASPTDFAFTSQRKDGFGLYDYNARYYSPYLGRFVSADTVVPEPGNPQSWNHYSYTRNNPLKYVDPTGHAECWDAECEHRINPETKEFIGNKEIVRSFTDEFEHVYRRPQVTASQLEKAFILQSLGAGIDAAAAFVSSSGAVIETSMTLKGAVAGGPKGALLGSLAGVAEYNKRGLNIANDFLGGGSLSAALGSDVFAGNTYFTYDARENSHYLIVGTGSQFSFTTAVAGLASPEAVLDLAIDGVSLVNDTASSFQLGDKAAGKPIFKSLGLPTESLADKLFTSRRIPLPQSLDRIWRSFEQMK